MQEPSIRSNLAQQLVSPARNAVSAALSVFNGRTRKIPTLTPLRVGRRAKRADEHERPADEAVVLDAYRSMRAGNPLRSDRLLSEWVKARGDKPEDYAWLATRIMDWDDQRHITRLTEQRITCLLALKRTGDALDVIIQRLTVDPYFRPLYAADTLKWAQLAARGGGAIRVAKVLLSDFSIRFAGDPRVAVAVALKRHLAALATPSRKTA